MKAVTYTYIVAAMMLGLIGCRTNDSMEPRATSEHYFPHSEPYSKEQRETITEPAGAQSQSREGVENPFIEPKAGESQQFLPSQGAPPQEP